jgi:Skp family chaperone for outer membrane proteins
MRSFKPLFAMAFAGLVALAPGAFAQTPAASPALVAPTIALVDMQRVVGESAAGRSIQTQLEAERRRIRDQLAKLQDESKTS